MYFPKVNSYFFQFCLIQYFFLMNSSIVLKLFIFPDINNPLSLTSNLFYLIFYEPTNKWNIHIFQNFIFYIGKYVEISG